MVELVASTSTTHPSCTIANRPCNTGPQVGWVVGVVQDYTYQQHANFLHRRSSVLAIDRLGHLEQEAHAGSAVVADIAVSQPYAPVLGREVQYA